MNEEKVQPFDSFTVVYNVLVWAGYYKLLKKHSRFKRICYQVYRILAFSAAIVYNLQHLIYIIKTRGNIKHVLGALETGIPHFNLIVKYLTVNLQMQRIDKLNKILSEPIFAADSKVDEYLLLQNKTSMHRLSKFMIYGITVPGLLWPVFYFVKRYQDETAVVPSYVPFDTDTWGKFSISVALEVVPFLWVGNGHLALDCVVATYYAQARVQLQIIKYNLKHLFDTNNLETSQSNFQYRDVNDMELKNRFVYYVHRYEKVAWYTKEIDNVFTPAISFQFFTAIISLCAVAYEMSSTPVVSVQFIFLMILIIVFLLQIFLYCYFGYSVQYESQSVVDALYLSDWLSVSPQFRRLLLIAMLRWSCHLKPTVACIIPLSISTSFTFCRAAYSLYAVLSTAK